MNYPGLQARDGDKVLIKRALAKNKERHMAKKFLFRAEAHQNKCCLSTPGLKARVIHNSTYSTQYHMHSILLRIFSYNCA